MDLMTITPNIVRKIRILSLIADYRRAFTSNSNHFYLQTSPKYIEKAGTFLSHVAVSP